VGNHGPGAQTRGWRLFSKNTGLCEAARRRIGSDACPVPEKIVQEARKIKKEIKKKEI